MRGFLKNSLIGSGLLLLGLSANAQVYRGDNGYYRGDPGYGYSNNGYDYRSGREPLDRVRADLDRAAADVGYLSRGEMSRFNHAREEIAEFQSKWNRGFFDRHELDDVIGSLQHVVNSNRLRYQDRDILIGDLERLREVRARRGRYSERRGYYDDDRYGYRR